MTDRLAEIAQQFADARAELAELRARLPQVQARVAELRPQVVEAIVEDIRTHRRTQVEISRLTGYSPERIRQICRAAGVEPGE
jgi:F0F1-type ATP synthase membrane subunit b/b'